MATAVTIQITVDSAQAQQAMSALTKTLEETGVNADVAFKKAGQRAQQMGGHMATSLDAVRLLSQEFGLRLPRAIEAMLSRMPAVTSALGSMLGGLAGIAALEVFAHLAEDGYKLYNQYISLNAQADKFYETLKKTAQEDFSQTRSIETTRRRLDSATSTMSSAPKDAEALQRFGVGNLMQGQFAIGIAGMMAAHSSAASGVEAAGNVVKLTRKQIDDEHELALAKINSDHAADALLKTEQKINAELDKRIAISAENRKYDHKVEGSLSNPSGKDSGAQKEALEGATARGEAQAQITLLDRASSLAIMKSHDEMIQSRLFGDQLYARKFEDIGREMTLSMQNEGKGQTEIHASILAAQSKLDEEYADKWISQWRTHQETMANARAGGLSGAARITADLGNAQNRNNSNPELVASGGAHDANVAAAQEATQKLKELQDNFTQSTLASIATRTEADLGAWDKIDAEGKKALDDLNKAYDKAFKDDQGNDLGTPAVHAAMDTARSAIAKKMQDDKNRLTQANNAQDLAYAEEATRAEARVREDGMMGWVASYRNAITEINAEDEKRTTKMQEEAQKQGATQQEIAQRKIDIDRAANAQIEQQQQQMQHQIAGTLQQAFTSPVEFIKSAMEKMFFEIVAAWIMRMKAFQAIFGAQMGAMQPGGGTSSGSGIGGMLGGIFHPGGSGTMSAPSIGGTSTSTTGGSVAGGTSGTASMSSASTSAASSASAVPGMIGGAITSVTDLAKLAGVGSGPSATASKTDSSSVTPGVTGAQQTAAAAGSASGDFSYAGDIAAVGGGAYNAYTGFMGAFKSGNPLTGAMADGAEGAAIGTLAGGPAGTVIGAAVGAGIGAASGIAGMVDGMGGKMSARDYYNKQVFPQLDGLMTHPPADFQAGIIQANQTANTALIYMGAHFGMEAANWVNDNYMKKELAKVDKLIADTAAGGRQYTTMSTSQFHSGGVISDFGDWSTSSNEGMIHAMLGETVMNPGASSEHGGVLAAMNAGASAADIASKYLAGSTPSGGGATGSSGGDTHFHIHTLDTKTMAGWLRGGGAQLITKHQNNYASQYAGDGISG